MMEASFSAYEDQLSDMSFAFSSHLNFLMQHDEESQSFAPSVSGVAEQLSHDVDSRSDRRPMHSTEKLIPKPEPVPTERETTSPSHIHTDCFATEGQHDKFMWSADVQHIFARVVLHIGLVGIKPKAIFKLFPKRFNLNCQQLGSHLQKYKLKTQKDFRLSSFDEFENWMYPQHLRCDVLDQLAMKWRGSPCTDAGIDITFKE